MEFTVYGHPYVKKSNQRVGYNPRMKRIIKYDTPSYKQWHNDALKQLAIVKKPEVPIDYPVNLQCRFFMSTKGRVDLSALYEGIQDVLVEVGVLADDNYRIVASHDGSGVDYDKQNPRIEVKIMPKEDNYGKEN
jgi:Holliday junction resolvase RusA-like endonuclease